MQCLQKFIRGVVLDIWPLVNGNIVLLQNKTCKYRLICCYFTYIFLTMSKRGCVYGTDCGWARFPFIFSTVGLVQ